MKEKVYQKKNNFNLLRLLFALQVFYVHLREDFQLPELIGLTYFPGVPGFFFVSGFLIYGSYLSSPNDSNYFLNRFLRIYPALMIVVLASFFYLIFLKGLDHFIINFEVYLIWLIGQLTLYQVYTPDFFRDVGTGTINGSLWTISIELTFYLLIPFIVRMERYFKHVILFSSIISFIIYFYLFHYLENFSIYNYGLGYISRLTIFTSWWMFGIGILFFKYYKFLFSKKLINCFFIFFIPFLIIFNDTLTGNLFLESMFVIQTFQTGIGLVYYISYAYLIFFIAFHLNLPEINNDYSYSIYLWHAPIINLFIIYNYDNYTSAILIVLIISVISWFLVEKKLLRFKRYSINTKIK